MSVITESKQKVEYINHELTKRGKSDYILLTYKRLDGQNPGTEMRTGAFVTQLDEASRTLIKGKGVFVITKTKEGEYWNLTKVESADNYVAKPPSTFNKGGYTAGGAKSTGGTFNNAGIKVGAVLHDAVAVYAADGGAPSGESAKDCIRTIAEELLHLSYELEANVNAGKYEPKGSTVGTTTNTSVLAKTQTAAEDTSLDNIDF